MTDTLYMKCYCPKFCDCANEIPYMHHHGWGRDEDFMCEECIDKCLSEEE